MLTWPRTLLTESSDPLKHGAHLASKNQKGEPDSSNPSSRDLVQLRM